MIEREIELVQVRVGSFEDEMAIRWYLAAYKAELLLEPQLRTARDHTPAVQERQRDRRFKSSVTLGMGSVRCREQGWGQSHNIRHLRSQAYCVQERLVQRNT